MQSTLSVSLVHSDLIKDYHKYIVNVPSVYIAVPFKSGGLAGKVIYTRQVFDLDVKFNMGVDWEIDGIKEVDENLINGIRKVMTDDEDSITANLNKIQNFLSESATLNYNERINPNGDTKSAVVTGLKKL